MGKLNCKIIIFPCLLISLNQKSITKKNFKYFLIYSQGLYAIKLTAEENKAKYNVFIILVRFKLYTKE